MLVRSFEIRSIVAEIEMRSRPPGIDGHPRQSEIVDGEIIQIDSTDSSTIQIEFGGELPSDSIGDDFFSVPGMSPDAVNQEISVPTIKDIITALPLKDDRSIPLPIVLPFKPGDDVTGSQWRSAILPIKTASFEAVFFNESCGFH